MPNTFTRPFNPKPLCRLGKFSQMLCPISHGSAVYQKIVKFQRCIDEVVHSKRQQQFQQQAKQSDPEGSGGNQKILHCKDSSLNHRPYQYKNRRQDQHSHKANDRDKAGTSEDCQAFRKLCVIIAVMEPHHNSGDNDCAEHSCIQCADPCY